MKKALIFLTRSQVSFFGSNLPAIAVLDLPTTLFQDMEIIDKEAFIKTVTGFIDTNKIAPTEFMQVLNNDLIFEKEIKEHNSPISEQNPKTDTPIIETKEQVEEKIKQESEEFLKVVPFENILSMVDRKDKKSIKIYAANKDLFDTLNQILTGKGFVSQGITALSLVGMNQVSAIDPHTAGELLSHYEKLRQHKFSLTEEVKVADEDIYQDNDNTTEGSSNNTKMIGILILLILILGGLGYVIWKQFTTKPVPAQTLSTRPAASKKIITPTSALSSSPPATPSATLDEKETSIQILNATGLAGQADQVRSEFTKQGFTNVETGNAPGTLSQTLVVFSDKLKQPTQDKIIAILKLRYPNISVKESTETEYDAIVTLVRQISPTPSSQ